MKVCTKCKIEKSFDEFYKCKSRKDGLQSSCKLCIAEMNKHCVEKLKARNHVEIPKTKTCYKCKLEKTSDEFYKSKNRKDGLQSACKLCTSEMNKRRDEKFKVRTHIEIPKTKKCSKCRVEKFSHEFTKNRKSNDGLYWYCKSCAKKYYEKLGERTYIEIPTTKICSKCRKRKHSENFYKNKVNKDGLSSQCNSCIRENYKKLLKRTYIEIPKTKVCSKCKIEKPSREFYKAKNRILGLDYWCKQCRKEYGKLDEIKKVTYKRHRERYKNDEIYKLQLILRGNIYRSIKLAKKSSNEDIKKSRKSLEYIGCTIEELKNHLEKQFYPHPKTGEEMTWENHSRKGWHVDHIKPLTAFDLTSEEEIMKANHYTNLQPLWAEENLSKGNIF